MFTLIIFTILVAIISFFYLMFYSPEEYLAESAKTFSAYRKDYKKYKYLLLLIILIERGKIIY